MSEKTANQSFGDSFRSLAGLPARSSNKPLTNGEGVSEATIVTEPKGGYGGGTIDNQQSMRRTENLVSQGSDLVGTEFGDGLKDPSVAKLGAERKQAARKEAVGPVTGASKGKVTVADSGENKSPVARKEAVKKAAKKSAAQSAATS